MANLKEVSGPDGTYFIELETPNESADTVLHALATSFPESVSVDLVKEDGDTTKIIAHSRENSVIRELRELQEDGKVTKFTVK